MAEKKADTLHRVSVTLDGVGSTVMQNSLEHVWRPTRHGKQLRGRHIRQTPLMSVSPNSTGYWWNQLYQVKSPRSISHVVSLQHNMKHVADPFSRWNGPQCPAELPKVNMIVPGPQFSFPVSTMPAFPITHRGTLPAITSKKCQSQMAKVNRAGEYYYYFMTRRWKGFCW